MKIARPRRQRILNEMVFFVHSVSLYSSYGEYTLDRRVDRCAKGQRGGGIY